MKHRSTRRRRLRAVALLAVPALFLAACGDDDDEGGADTTQASAGTTAGGATTSGSGGGAGTSVDTSANEASDTGVSEDAYTIGVITSETGVAAPNNTGMLEAIEARIQLQNDQGGVYGREIRLEHADDASTPTQNLAAAQTLVGQRDIFVLINQTPFVFGSFRYTTEEGIPVLGGGYDGPEWFQAGNENMISISGHSSPNRPTYTNLPQFIKDRGGERVAGLGYGQSPSSSDAARKFHDLAVPAVGLTPAYLNISIPFGSVDVGAIALDMRNNDVDSMYMAMNNNTNFAIITAAKQAGVDVRVAISATGYGQTLLDQPTAVQTAQGTYFTTVGTPAEADTPAVRAMRDAFEEYADFTGIPGFDWYQGWITADLLIKGLEAAGQNPTRQDFIDGLHDMGSYDGAGLYQEPVDISLEGFGKAPERICGYFVVLEGNEFKPVPESGEAVCGDLVPGSDQ